MSSASPVSQETERSTRRLALGDAERRHISAALADTDALLATAYPGDDGSRQPIHTVYIPADTFEPDLALNWGRTALAAADAQGGLEAVATGLSLAEPAALAGLVERKLGVEPIEDLRLDFEDGFGSRPDEEEDAHALAAGQKVSLAVQAGTAPPFIGIRFKCFEEATRERGLRTLDLFVSSLLEHGELPAGLILTLPKVSTVAQVQAMDYACGRLEEVHGLPRGRLRFEVQMETPQLILAADGTVPVAQLLHAAPGRISALHYGTYDYSASLEISAAHQSMEHPAADYAKEVMQVAVAGTGVRISDGSTNVLPIGSPENIASAWALHSRLVARSLAAGYYQGWDLHAAQLVTRYLATYDFYRSGFSAAALRLKNYVHKIESTILDEPATARALARFIHRGLVCGAVTESEVSDQAGISVADLTTLAHPKVSTEKRNQK
ncbi:citrate lyase beta subunit [Arthrobacter sp. UYP6]